MIPLASDPEFVDAYNTYKYQIQPNYVMDYMLGNDLRQLQSSKYEPTFSEVLRLKDFGHMEHRVEEFGSFSVTTPRKFHRASYTM